MGKIKNIMNKKLIISLLMTSIISCGIPLTVLSAPIQPVQGGYDAGSINKYNIDFIKRQEQEKKKLEEFQKFQKQKNLEPDKKIDKIQPIKDTKSIKNQDPAIKATIEKYKKEGVQINKVEIDESEIFTKEELEAVIKPLIGKKVSLKEIKKVVDTINDMYLAKNYVTARAYIAEQTIEDGSLKISLMEGRVGELRFDNNRWTRDSFMAKRLPSAKPGELLELRKLEQDIIEFNHVNEGININANLVPGKVVGTTDVEVSARESFPFHITFATDNAGRETIGMARFGTFLTADSLFGHRDQLTAGTYLSRSSVTPFVDYNIPFNKSGGRIGASFSTSNMDITRGYLRDYGVGGQSYATTLYVSQPIIDKPFLNLTNITSASYKTAKTSLRDFGNINSDRILSIGTGLMARHDTKRGIWYTNQNVSYAFSLENNYDNYFKYEGGILRIHDFGHGIVGQLRTSWQYSPEEIIPSLDQFQIGGATTVRGYSEGALIGRTGYVVSGELIFPITPVETRYTFKDKEHILHLRDVIKGAVFVDHAGIFPYKGIGGPGVTKDDFLTSVGFGFRVALPGDLTGKFYWGFPVTRNDTLAYEYMPRFHFEIMATPDFDGLLALKERRRAEKLRKEQVEKEQL